MSVYKLSAVNGLVSACPSNAVVESAEIQQDKPCEIIQDESAVDFNRYESGDGKWNPSASTLVLPVPKNHPLEHARLNGFKSRGNHENSTYTDINGAVSDAFGRGVAKCIHKGVDAVLESLDRQDRR